MLVPDTSDTALQFLEMAMGESGVDLLLNLAERTTMNFMAHQAKPEPDQRVGARASLS